MIKILELQKMQMDEAELSRGKSSASVVCSSASTVCEE